MMAGNNTSGAPENHIAVAGTGYVGLSNAVLLAQHNRVIALDIVPEKVELLNNKQSPIEDAEAKDFFAKWSNQKLTYNSFFVTDLKEFKQVCQVVIVNSLCWSLKDVVGKVCSRDLLLKDD